MKPVSGKESPEKILRLQRDWFKPMTSADTGAMLYRLSYEASLGISQVRLYVYDIDHMYELREGDPRRYEAMAKEVAKKAQKKFWGEPMTSAIPGR